MNSEQVPKSDDHVLSKDSQANQTREDPKDPSQKLCIDAIADTWGQQHGLDPSQYKEKYARILGLEGASPEQLNLAWEENMTLVESKAHGSAAAAKIMEQFKLADQCR